MTHRRLCSEIRTVLQQTGVQPVLLDLGAAGSPPPSWTCIGQASVYVGFEPDARELLPPSGDFAASHVIPAAAVAEPAAEVLLYLTEFPFCSSTLRPLRSAVAPYAYADLYEVVGERNVPAVTLGSAMQMFGLSRVHWFKADTQGTDLRLFRSLPDVVRHGVLAVDVEPGLMDSYEGEDLFAPTHEYFTREGYWISRLDVKGALRMSARVLKDLTPALGDATAVELRHRHRISPIWCEARYLRTIASLSEHPREDWVVMWVFAMIDDQTAFAADLAVAYRARFAPDPLGAQMLGIALRRLRDQFAPSPFKRLVRGVIPENLRRKIFRTKLFFRRVRSGV